MAFDFKFPDVGEGIHEGKIVKWLVKEGDEVKADQSIAEVETDKAVVEIPAPQTGKIAKLYHKEGETMKVGEVMATFEGDAKNAATATEQGVVGSLEPTATGVMKAPTSNGAVFNSSSAGANNVGVSLGTVAGAISNGGTLFNNPFGNSGAVFGGGQASNAQQTPAVQSSSGQQGQGARPEAAASQPASTQTGVSGGPQVAGASQTQPGASSQTSGGSMAGVIKAGIKAVKKYDLFGYIDRAPYDGIRKAVGDHMVKSVFTAPHVTHMDSVDVTNLWNLREKEKKEAEKDGIKLTFLAYILRATVAALQKFPAMNAILDEQNREIIFKKYYNIGIAVDTEAGLMVPVLKGADKKHLFQIAKEIADLAEKARTRKINPMDFKGGTFTITNVGSAGSGEYFTPVINFPEAAILGVGLIKDVPLAVDGKVEIRKVLYLSLSFDHRIIDGAQAAAFVKMLKELLQDPEGAVVSEGTNAAGTTKEKSHATDVKNSSKEAPEKPKKSPGKRLIAKKK